MSVVNVSRIDTLVDLLRCRAHENPEHVIYTQLPDGEGEGIDLTFADMDRQARAMAVELQRRGMAGQRALMLYPSNTDFLIAFFACQYAGVVAVPAYPPRKNQSIGRLQAIAKDCQAQIVLATEQVMLISQPMFSELESLKGLPFLAQEAVDIALADEWQASPCDAGQVAFLQYTSGSTGDPKGVMLTHKNILYNHAVIKEGLGHNHTSSYVSWLPLFHDMGLACAVQAMFIASHCTLMAPAAFIQKPKRWLWAISNNRAHTSGGPNFAFDLCVKTYRPEDYEGLDLSCWNVAFSGAEPVRAKTLDRFLEVFGQYGLTKKALYPCYGLAEATVAVSGGDFRGPPIEKTLDLDALSNNQIKYCEQSSSRSDRYIASGYAHLEDQIVIVDPDTLIPCAEDQVGEVWVSSPSVGVGYWGREALSKETFYNRLEGYQGSFLRTGDLGFIDQEQLFITGRKKDLIIIRGRNYYPQDIELVAEQSHPAMSVNSSAGFAVEKGGESYLVLVLEVERRYVRKFEPKAAEDAIRRAIAEQFELQVSAIVFLKPGRVPKTSSGKVMRRAASAKFLEGSFEFIHQWLSPLYGAQEPLSSSSLTNKLYAHAVAPLKTESHPATVGAEVGLDRAEQSRAKADDLIVWLREYAKTRFNSFEVDERRTLPPHVILDFGNKGLLGMQVAVEYGGLGLQTKDALRVIEQLVAIDGSLALFIGLNNSIGILPISHYASEETKAALLPDIAQGRILTAFALTEDGAGSNPWAISTVAEKTAGGWLISGQKEWIGLASWSNVITTFAQAKDEKGQPLGISCFLVRQGAEGLSQGPEALTMGMRGVIQNRVFFDKVFVSDDAVVGSIGQGMAIAQDAMMYTRLGIAAMCLGMLKRSAQLIHRYSRRRTISSGLLMNNPVVQDRLNEIHCRILTLEALIKELGDARDEGAEIPDELYAAIKILAPEWAWYGVDQLMQLLGGRGYIESNLAPRMMRDCRVLRVFEGPTEALTAFLGAQMEVRGEAFNDFMSKQLNASELLEELYQVLDETVRVGSGSDAKFQERSSKKHWIHQGVGQITAASIALGTVQKAALSNQPRIKSQHYPVAVEWCKRNLDTTIKGVFDGLVDSSSQVEKSDLEEVIAQYSNDIGEVEQKAAEPERSLNPWLQLNPNNEQLDRYQSYGSASRGKLSATEGTQAVALSSQGLKIQRWVLAWLSDELAIDESEFDVSENLMSYGVDSVLVMRLTGDLSAWLEIELPQGLLWDYPTIGEACFFICQLLQQGNKGFAAIEAMTVIDDESVNGPFELSSAQQRMWIVNQLEDHSANYNLCAAMKITGPLNIEVLRRSFEALVSRHSILRARFEEVDGVLQQFVDACAPWSLELKDLRTQTANQKQSALQLALESLAQHQFDLQHGELLRSQLIQMSDQENYLQVNIHHIVADGWSVRIFTQELSQLYSAFLNDQPIPLPSLPIQYLDFARWQNKQYGVDEKVIEEEARQINYWRGQLDGVSELGLPVDYPRPMVLTARGGHVHFDISEQKTAALQLLGRKQGSTLYNTLLSIFSVLLYRYTGQEDICIGSPVANRTRSDIEPLIGMFVNTVALRLGLSGELSFETLLDRSQSVVKSAYANQSLPFERLVDELVVERDPSRSPLFQVMFVFHSSALIDDMVLEGLELESINVESGASKFDLIMEFVEVDGQLKGSFEYNTDLYKEATIHRMVSHFENLLDSVLAAPSLAVGELNLLAASERKELLVDWNQSGQCDARAESIHARFERQVSMMPQAEALAFEATGLTYVELEQRANQLAHFLVAKGVRPGDFVGLCFDRGLEVIVSILAVLKVGAAYIPLDPASPQERNSYIIDDASIAWMIVDTVERLVGFESINAFSVQQESEALAGYDNFSPDINVDPSATAYAIYTSGTTGRPKGVLITHHNVARLFDSSGLQFDFQQQDVWTLFHSFAFDFSVWEIWGALFHGAKLVIVPQWAVRSAHALEQLLIDQKVTILNQTPSAFSQLVFVNQERSAAEISENPFNLRYIIFAGEAIDHHSLRIWADRYGLDQPALINMYGITETTVHSTYHQVTFEDLDRLSSNVGRPLADLDIHILDACQNPVPIGITGEIYVGGPGVAAGYLKRPELNEQRFLSLSLPGVASHVLYRSGDLARYLANGDIEYVGRIDDQVKLRGFRIELGEIETQINNFQGVQECVCLMSGTGSEARIVAYVVPKQGVSEFEAQGVEALKSSLKTKLPEYMIPSAFMLLPSIAMNANGKVDRKALLALKVVNQTKQEFVAPSSETEKTLVTLWCEVLNITELGINDNFFDLGGHSLLATKLVSRVRKAFDIDIPLRVLFKMLTISDMSKYIDTIEKARVDAVAVASNDDPSGRQEIDI